MKKMLTTWIATCIVFASGCVTNAEFAKYKEQAELTDKILLCESRNDAYQDLMGSDEPSPTRRDEPSGTRRDQACTDEFNDITQGNVQACKDEMQTCIDADTHPNQDCRTCHVKCLETGTWPVTGAPSCPET